MSDMHSSILPGKQQYINYNGKSSRDDVHSRCRQVYGTPKHFSNVQVEHIPLQDFKSVARMSPLTVRSSRIQDSSFINAGDTEEIVAKISAMFPTVSDTHIRLLLRNCRYMKSVFPDADETVILEVLQNNDNSIQKTSDSLKEMGFSKKDAVQMAKQKMEVKIEEKKQEEKQKEKTSESQPKTKTSEEKAQIKSKLREEYTGVAEYLISIALESVNFDENRARQILQIMVQEDSDTNNKKNGNEGANTTEEKNQQQSETDSKAELKADTIMPVSQSRQSIKSLMKERNEKDKSNSNRCSTNNGDGIAYPFTANSKGHNPSLAKGPNEKLLLEDYVKWQGPNPSLRKGSQGLAKGANKSLLSNRTYIPCGPNAELHKGPQIGLAKGSMFAQLKSVIVGDSRGN